MSVVKLNPVDGLPEWEGRRVTPEWRKRRNAKRARRFVMIEWGELVTACHTLKVSRAMRLLMMLYLHRNLSKSRDGWVHQELKDLVALKLADSNFHRDVAKLKTLGLVEVQHRPGKRPLLRLVKP